MCEFYGPKHLTCSITDGMRWSPSGYPNCIIFKNAKKKLSETPNASPALILKTTRKNMRLKRNVCFALNNKWKSARSICDELGGYFKPVSDILKSLTKYNLLKRTKSLARMHAHCLSINLTKENVR